MSGGAVFEAGDAVFFWGEDDLISDGIRFFTGGLRLRAPSHVATLYDPCLLLPDGSGQKEWNLIESTELNGVNGVQLNTLASRTNGYHGAVAIATLDPDIRAFLKWPRVWGCANHKLGVTGYNVAELAEYLANLVLPGALQIDDFNPKAAQCAELRAEMLRAGGLPGLHPFGTPPAALFRMRMYSGLQALSGAPPMEEFNSV